MEIKDILDRFELLDPDNRNLSDLRRAYSDRDLSSIFRLIETDKPEFLDDLRKAVMDKNIYSIFRLIETDKSEFLNDLRKAVIDKNFYSIFRLIEIDKPEFVGELSDLRKAVIDNNIYSIFRLIETNSPVFTTDNDDFLENLRKAIADHNIRSLFKLLNTDGSDFLEDLRKAVTDQNLHSVFRLCDSEELRKAVIEENLHSLFRLVKNDGLRKLLLEDNIWELWKLLKKHSSNYFHTALKQMHSESIEFDSDCLSQGQLKSKLWLIKELKNLDLDLRTVFVCAGWYSSLSTLIFENNLSVDKIRSFDIDKSCLKIAEIFNKPWVTDQWKFKAVCEDIMNIDYDKHKYIVYRSDDSECELEDSPNTIVNTSCEHIENFQKWYEKIPQGKIVILQTNNYFSIEDHVNCSASLEEFAMATPMGCCLYQGELDLGKYKRFMRIGYR